MDLQKNIGMCDSFYLTKNHTAWTIAFENERIERRSNIRTIFGGHIRLDANTMFVVKSHHFLNNGVEREP